MARVKDLPTNIKPIAIQYAKNYYPKRKEEEILNTDLRAAFAWNHTKEGYNYWSNVEDDVCEKKLNKKKIKIISIIAIMLSFSAFSFYHLIIFLGNSSVTPQAAFVFGGVLTIIVRLLLDYMLSLKNKL